ncbi:cytochrome P450 [Alkalicoccus luteus]|uniref:cytochrome P450 n=1 Tax=Alkalicoccus luteus TaxID=1237094 RepID=UPI001FE87E95|nr:cytochrome P450 [Alkalicoccus luteus]
MIFIKEENRNIPEEEGMDHSLKLLKEGYQFILNRRYTMESNIFETKLLGETAICLTGSKMAELFYDTEKFKREGAAPKPVQKTLFGEGGVQGLDGEAHRHRKAMFMQVMKPDDLQTIRRLFAERWQKHVRVWEQQDEMQFYKNVKTVLFEAACEWTGVPLEEDTEARAEQISEMFETPAHIGLRHLKGWKARSDAEKWMISYVEQVRNGELDHVAGTPLEAFSLHRDHNGEQLEAETAAVELLNLIRPITAISVYAAFTALALHEYPGEASKLDSDDARERFVQEVRRYYPFFPFTAARVRKDFTWEGHTFKEDTLTLLDLYGTNHHPEEWENPGLFRPSRFEGWQGTPFQFIPQGGGEFDFGHRCAGEWMTVELLKEIVYQLHEHLSYDLPDQKLSFSLTEIPAIPESGIILKNVQPV